MSGFVPAALAAEVDPVEYGLGFRDVEHALRYQRPVMPAGHHAGELDVAQCESASHLLACT